MAELTLTDHFQRRRARAEKDIAAANGDISTLRKLLRDRRSLARIYREDGARLTAICIDLAEIEPIRNAISRAGKAVA